MVISRAVFAHTSQRNFNMKMSEALTLNKKPSCDNSEIVSSVTQTVWKSHSHLQVSTFPSPAQDIQYTESSSK